MPINLTSVSPTNPADDPLRKGPPVPPLRSAKPAAKSGNGNSGGAAHLLSSGASPIASVMGDMMEIQKRIQSISQIRPDIAQLFAPVIGQARDMMAGSLADLAQGGTGTPPQDVATPPPQVGPPQGGPPGAGPGGPMPPPPPMMR